MFNKYLLIAYASLAVSCQPKEEKTQAEAVVFNQALAEELAVMKETDQIAAYIPQGKYAELSEEQWKAFKDSVFTTHQKRLEIILNEYGFPGYDRVGKKGASDFWLMTQHSDYDPDFQKRVLVAMKAEVEKGNASAQDFGYLTDRVRLNTGRKQLYGTQLQYNTHICQAYPKPLSDSAQVNERRATIGLEPLEVYLNSMSELHFQMNKTRYEEKGITEAALYPLPSSQP